MSNTSKAIGFGVQDRLLCSGCGRALALVRRTPAGVSAEGELQTFACHGCGSHLQRSVNALGAPLDPPAMPCEWRPAGSLQSAEGFRSVAMPGLSCSTAFSSEE